jgi:hypothetical protein
MVNDLIDGISVKLNQVFGNGYKIYSEEVKQGLKEPCFLIVSLNPSSTQVIGNRYFRQTPFDIHYFPAVIGNNEEINGVASRLFDALEYITLLNNDLVRGTEMHYEKVDNVLHFFVQYNLHIRKVVTPEDNMETLTVNTDVEG